MKYAGRWIGLALLCAATPLPAQGPLSSIDWMTDVLHSVVPKPQINPAQINEPTVATSASIAEVTVTSLDEAVDTTIGLLPSNVTGLPKSLWIGSKSPDLAKQIKSIATPHYPAMQDLLRLLLLAESDAPSLGNTLLLARVDALYAMGSLEAALALVSRATPLDRAKFKRIADIAFILGVEDTACQTWADAPGLSNNSVLRIFCLARAEDWMAASLTLRTTKALGQITPAKYTLLEQFLDPELAESGAMLPPSAKIEPLEFRLRDAVGAPVPSGSLPLPFAIADLSGNTGWKTRLEAAERLARVGAIPDNQLLGVFTEKVSSASGQIWGRVDALQRLDIAIKSRNPSAVSKNLAPSFTTLSEAGLTVPLARLYADQLASLPLTGNAQAIALRLGYLSASYEKAATTADPSLARAIALGDVDNQRATTALEQAILDGFSPEPARVLTKGSLGARILTAIEMIEAAHINDMSDLATGLATLRSVGLEDMARRAALQVLLL